MLPQFLGSFSHRVMVGKDRVTVDSKMNMIVVSEHRGQKVLGRADVMEVSGGATREGRELPKP